MKDYRRPVDYHNERHRKVSDQFPGHPPTAPEPRFIPTHYMGELKQVNNIGGRGSFSLDPRPH